MNEKLLRLIVQDRKQKGGYSPAYLQSLRYHLARAWLGQRGVAPARLTNALSALFPKSAAKLPPATAQMLRPWLAAAAPEGDTTAFTPEIISLLAETLQPASGVYYTPFQTACQLSRQTLAAWLQSQGFAPFDWEKAARLPLKTRREMDRRLAQLYVCDPAAGAGGLVIPFWLMLAQLRGRLNPSHATGDLLDFIWHRNLYAADIQPQAIQDLHLRASLTLLSYHRPLPAKDHLYTLDALSGTSQSIWKKTCPEVFARGGFDIYLANPPYVGQKNHKEIFTSLRTNPRWQPWLAPKGDLLYLFFHLAFELLHPAGIAGLLTTAYFTHAAGAYTLRKRLKEEATLWRVIDFGEKRLFKRAKGQHNFITVFSVFPDDKIRCLCGGTAVPCAQQDLFSGPALFLCSTPAPEALQTALAKMAAAPYRLNEIAQISNGLMTGCDEAFILTAPQKQALKTLAKENQKLKPFFKNSDISAYTAARTPRLYLIDFFYPNDRDTDFSLYPHLMDHLKRFKEKLLARRQNNNGIHKQLAEGKYWFGSVRRRVNFEAEKIVVAQRADTNKFAYTRGPWYASSDVYFILAPRPPFTLWYLLALLNSRPYFVWLFYQGKRKGRLLELYAQPLGQVPLAAPSKNVQNKLATLARRIYELKQQNPSADTRSLQQQIDRHVCRLFHFTTRETKAVLDTTCFEEK